MTNNALHYIVTDTFPERLNQTSLTLKAASHENVTPIFFGEDIDKAREIFQTKAVEILSR